MSEPSFAGRLWGGLKTFTITLVVLALVGATLFLLSQLNARTFSLDMREGQLVVLKGRMLPYGAEPWRPSDAALADAYAPVDLDGAPALGIAGLKFTERDELDRAMFSVIENLAKPRVASDDFKTLEKGLYYLRRGDKLTGLTDEQKISLKQLRSDVAFYTARMRLEEAQKQVQEALVQLKLASEANNKHARAANQMITAIEPEAKALTEALRKAVYTLSAPPPSTPASASVPADGGLPTP